MYTSISFKCAGSTVSLSEIPIACCVNVLYKFVREVCFTFSSTTGGYDVAFMCATFHYKYLHSLNIYGSFSHA